MMKPDILLFAKTDRWSDTCVALARVLFGDRLLSIQASTIDPFPDHTLEHRWSAVISFLSPWIVPPELLDRAALAINFHPGSCDYPGIGCYNFALYEGAEWYGPVCHHMLAKVDAGALIDERLFRVAPTETVESLKLRTMVAMIAMAHDVFGLIANGDPLPVHHRGWTRPPFRRRQLEALGLIAAEMAPEEILRRVRAMTYPGYPGASLTLAGIPFVSLAPHRPPLA